MCARQNGRMKPPYSPSCPPIEPAAVPFVAALAAAYYAVAASPRRCERSGLLESA
jgi:hypothetical protein